MIPVAGGSISLDDYQHLEHRLGRIAERIRQQGRKRRKLAEVLRRVKNDLRVPVDDGEDETIEPGLIHPVDDASLGNYVIVGVDGGVLSRPLHGLDLILVRSVAAIFYYEEGQLRDADYHPSDMPVPRLVNVHEPVDSRELDVLVGFERQLEEINRAKETASDRDIDALLLDGTIVPQYTDHASSSRTRELYGELIDSFTELYSTCTEREILLLGAVKDSRSSKLARMFQKKIFPSLLEDGDLVPDEVSSLDRNMDVLESSRDTAFLDYLLDARERTFAFSYAEAPANLLKDLGDWRKKIRAFYVKPVPYDRPVRVEVISGPEDSRERVERAASIVSSLSADHEACALPSVLIEADARAALAEEEISILRDNIADRLEPSTMLDLRRERRPF